jgi:hypothetical protein
VHTTEDLSVRFDAVADDTATAVRANRCERVDCALETIEDVPLSVHDDFKRLVIIIFANFACRHTELFAPEEVRGGVLFVANKGGIGGTGYKFPSGDSSSLKRREKLSSIAHHFG